MPRHVVIVGAGVIGLCSAHYLRQLGFDVTVVERHGPERFDCSYGNAGMISPSHFVPLAAPGMVAMGLQMMWNPESPFYIKPRLSRDLLGWGVRFCRACNPDHVERCAPLLRDLHLASRELFIELSRQLGAGFDLTTRGVLMLCNTQRALDHEAETSRAARELGLEATVLDARQTAELEPGIAMNIVGSVLFDQDCHMSPHKFMRAMQDHLDRSGVKFVWHSDVTGWRRTGDAIEAVVTTTGELAGDEFVLAGGALSGQIARGLGLKLPMQAGKGYSLTLPSPPVSPRRACICVEGRLAVTPMGGALRFGGTMEIAGFSEAINPARVRGLVKSAMRYFPDFQSGDFANVKPWCGMRPLSADGIPYLGRTRCCRNLVVATGHAMMGLSLGPVSGKLVSQVLAGIEPKVEMQSMSPDRYM